jgi:DNA-3-methyladenine glycosylase I
VAESTSSHERPVESRWTLLGHDGRPRCWWVGVEPIYLDYHDREWGWPQHDGRALFEKLSLESFQSGLSWLTILRKRDNFRVAFAGFQPEAMVKFDAADVDRLMADAGIVRNRAKIEAVLANAGCLLSEFGSQTAFSEYLWGFAPAAAAPRMDTRAQWAHPVPGQTKESVALARDLRRRGWRFLGPTTAYAFMQSVGMVDDHVAGCWRAVDPPLDS